MFMVLHLLVRSLVVGFEGGTHSVGGFQRTNLWIDQAPLVPDDAHEIPHGNSQALAHLVLLGLGLNGHRFEEGLQPLTFVQDTTPHADVGEKATLCISV